MDSEQLSKLLKELLKEQIIDACQQHASTLTEVVNTMWQQNELLRSQLTAAKDANTFFELAKNYQHQKIDHFNRVFNHKDVPFIPIDWNVYRQTIKGIILQNPQTRILEQAKERFYSQPGDSGLMRMLKWFKRLFYNISTIPKKFTDFFRKLFRKRIRRTEFWKYRLPWQRLLEYELENRLSEALISPINSIMKISANVLRDIIQQEDEFNAMLIKATLYSVSNKEELPKESTGDSDIRERNILTINPEPGNLPGVEVQALLSDYNQKVSEHLMQIKELPERSIHEIENYALIAGTIEYPALKIKVQNREKSKRKIFRKLRSINRGWGNTVFALMEDWRIDQEIYNLDYFTQQKADALTAQNRKLHAEVKALLDKSRTSLLQFKERMVQNVENQPEQAAVLLEDALKTVKRAIDKSNFDAVSERLFAFNYPAEISNFENKITDFLTEISEKRWLTRNTSYDQPINSSDLSSFSPRELIHFDSLPKLNIVCNEIKLRVSRQMEEVQQDILNMEHVVSFNISSLAESIKKGDCESAEIPKLTREGFDRSLNKLYGISTKLHDLEKEAAQTLQGAVKNFIESTNILTNNESAFDLRMTAMKAKAIRKGGLLTTKTIKRIRESFLDAKNKWAVLSGRIQQFLLPWKQRMGFNEIRVIDTELSDFLLTVNQKINSLPIIYQRLYRIVPLTELDFFTGRDHELKILDRAFSSWQKGKYAPVTIVGEKRSGLTTLINYFIQTRLKNIKVVFNNDLTYCESELAFLHCWQQVFQNHTLDTFDKLVHHLQKEYHGHVFVLENLQNYYLRTLHGFDMLKRIVALISATSKEIFWICSANTYAWNYLNKTMELASYFGYLVSIQAFDDEALRDLIMKKNNISGYKIIFKPSEANLASKKYLKLNEEEKQSYLRMQFFNELNNFARGNISLALSYWLLSTTDISEETIEITTFTSPDFSFVRNLNTEKVFILYLIVMHTGLTNLQLHQILNQPPHALDLVLTMMQDDGILVLKDGIFDVNPLIYRHCINMLKSKNLIQ